jgi:hypothetical protein
MIRHFVLLRFKDDVSEETKASIYGDLDALRRHIQGIRHFQAGPNVSVEYELIRGFKDAFWFDFENAAVRDAYLADAAHQAAGARIVAHTVGGPDGVVVVDMEI